MRLRRVDGIFEQFRPRQLAVSFVQSFPAAHHAGDRNRVGTAVRDAILIVFRRRPVRGMASGVQPDGLAFRGIMVEKECIAAQRRRLLEDD